jgi:geranylgeranyl diphosphate synthase type II
LPIIGAAIISNSAKSLVDSIRKYGFFVGPAFQIQDDILDLTEGKGRCEIGCDIKEGKRSFMVVHTAANCTLGEKKELFRILNKTREKKNAHDISRVIELFDKYEAIDSGQNEAKSLILRGKKEVANAPDRLRDVLHEFADYSIKRLH